MKIFHQVFRWPIRLLDWAGVRTVRLLGLHPATEHASIYTADELRHLIDAARKSGHVDPEQQRLINRVFDFADAEVREAMVPRVKIAALPLTATFAEVKEAFRTLRYSRLPVYRETRDDIVGVVFLKDVAALNELRSEEFNLASLLHPPQFIPGITRLGAALSRMQAARTHLAFVIDEHGGVEGIVTLEDLLEEIVGEIDDEYDEEVRAQILGKGGSYLLDGMLAVRDLNRRFSLHLPEHAGYMTLAGFLMSETGQAPAQGQSVEYQGARFTVERVEGRRIRRVRMIFAAAQAHVVAERRADGGPHQPAPSGDREILDCGDLSPFLPRNEKALPSRRIPKKPAFGSDRLNVSTRQVAGEWVKSAHAQEWLEGRSVSR